MPLWDANRLRRLRPLPLSLWNILTIVTGIKQLVIARLRLTGKRLKIAPRRSVMTTTMTIVANRLHLHLTKAFCVS